MFVRVKPHSFRFMPAKIYVRTRMHVSGMVNVHISRAVLCISIVPKRKCFSLLFRKIIVPLHPNLGNLEEKRMVAASVSEGFCTLIHGWEGEFGLPV